MLIKKIQELRGTSAMAGERGGVRDELYSFMPLPASSLSFSLPATASLKRYSHTLLKMTLYNGYAFGGVA